MKRRAVHATHGNEVMEDFSDDFYHATSPSACVNIQDSRRTQQREIVLAPEAALIIISSEQRVVLCRGCAERVKQGTSPNITHAHTHILAYWAGAPCCLNCNRHGVYCASSAGENQCNLQERMWFHIYNVCVCV